MAKRIGKWVRFKDFVYPLPAPDISWKLRYAPESLSKEEQLQAASIVSAYFDMVYDSQRKRNMVCSAMVKIIDRGNWY